MMIHRRLIGTVPESRRYIAGNVALQFLSLLANIALVLTVTRLLERVYRDAAGGADLILTSAVAVGAVAVRVLCTKGAAHLAFLSAKSVKLTLRRAIYEKLLRLGQGYRARVSTAEVVQVAVEGVDQLETYFGAYLPQLFYSLLAPLTLFAVLAPISLPAAVVLLICVPLIPVTIAAVQTFAKRLLAKYWGQYTALGDSFLENLQGLTTLKIYRADEARHRAMNREAEQFRNITMKVLTMQLNSITLMDIIAYGGAALGVILAALQLQAGAVSLAGALAIILLSADFYLPMRRLGSFFHIAMNGMAASDKIFRLLDTEEVEERGAAPFPPSGDLRCDSLHFSYGAEREVLRGVSLICTKGLTAIVGVSGCGKSTLAGLLTGRLRPCTGSIAVGDTPLEQIAAAERTAGITYVGFDSYLLKGTVRENLRMAKPGAGDTRLWEVLRQVNLAEFLHAEQGLDTLLTERGGNLSGGQRQRLALARALLRDSPIYIFDEATSNVDAESEAVMMAEITRLAQRKTVVLITHRLANAETAHRIYVMQAGGVREQGTHQALLQRGELYARLWTAQHDLERGRQPAQEEVSA